MLNRAALLLRYKQPFIDWINGVDPNPTSHIVTLDEINNDERTVYLVEVEDEEELKQWLKLNFAAIFESELHGWYTDPALWPKDRTLVTLQRWCSFELHTVVFDIGETALEDDDL